jgi:hypothetical protein
VEGEKPLITAAVVAHHSRRERAAGLHATLNAQFKTGLFLDDGRLGCDYNHLQAWDSIASAATTPWCAAFEDDAVPIPELAAQLEAALDDPPAPIVSLYLGRGRPPHWQVRIGNAMRFPDRPFIVTTHLLHCVAVCMRTELVHEMLTDARIAISSEVHKPIDEALTEAAQNRNLPVAYTNPSLVDHADEPSIANPRSYPALRQRVAWRVGVRQSWQGQFSVM